MARSLTFIQIIYKEEQRSSCYDFAHVHFNTRLTDSFENDVICNLIPGLKSDYLGIASWRLKQKRSEASTPQVLNHRLELTREKIIESDFDVAILTPRRPSFKMLDSASNWHGTVWQDTFSLFKTGFLNPRSISVPDIEAGEDVKHAIHENHFIARNEIYQEYVKDVLAPAIEFCNLHHEFKQDSGYVNKKRDLEEVREYQKKSGRIDWPIQPFILERLFSIWINDKNFNVINL